MAKGITAKLGWIYPSEGQETWYQIFQTLIGQQDADVYSALEDPNLWLRGGGIISLDAGADELTWTEDMEILAMLTGGIITITADTLTGFEDGKIAYVEVARPVVGSRELTLQVADTIGDNRNNLFIAVRRGDTVYMRNQVNRASVALVDTFGALKTVTSSAASGGGTVTGSIAVGVAQAGMWRVKVVANGNTVDSTVKFFSDQGMTDQIYEAANQDCYTSPYEDRNPPWFGTLTDGLLYYEITNDGANSSTYDIELAGMGEMAG